MNERRDPLPALPASAVLDVLSVPDPERGKSGPIVPMACPRGCGTSVYALPVKRVGVGYVACGVCPGAPPLEEMAT